MKEITLNLWEVSLSEIKQFSLVELFALQVLVYNRFTEFVRVVPAVGLARLNSQKDNEVFLLFSDPSKIAASDD